MSVNSASECVRCRPVSQGMSCPVGRTTNSFTQIPSGRLMMKVMHSASDSGGAGPAPSANIGASVTVTSPSMTTPSQLNPSVSNMPGMTKADVDVVLRQLEAKAVEGGLQSRAWTRRRCQHWA